MQKLRQKIENREAIVGIMGLGYVGLPLAMAFAKEFTVLGYDVNDKTIDSLRFGISHIKDVPSEVVSKHVGETFFPTIDEAMLAICDVFIICVPTPLNVEHEPELKYVESATKTIAAQLKKGQLVILESTTYPGTVDEVMKPILEESGLRAGIDFGLAHSPERIDPGNTSAVEDIPKVVGGITPECTDIAAALYGAVLKQIVPVSDAKTAEAVKILENTYRCINIALINEMATIFDKLGIDTWEVVKAASTKPYGYAPFYPGPGIGGHCIPLDPYYLTYQAKKFGASSRFIEIADDANHFMKIYTINLARDALAQVNKLLRNANVAIFGLTYKKNIDDTRESPAKYIIESLQSMGSKVILHDPYVSEFCTKNGKITCETNIVDTFNKADCVIFLIDHDEYRNISQEDIVKLMKNPIVVDCKNIFVEHDKLIYNGIGKGIGI